MCDQCVFRKNGMVVGTATAFVEQTMMQQINICTIFIRFLVETWYSCVLKSLEKLFIVVDSNKFSMLSPSLGCFLI